MVASYVHVNGDDVPSHDSDEVQQSLPPAPPPHQLQVLPTAPLLSDGTSRDTSDPLLSRDYLRRADDESADTSGPRSFAIASYNILDERIATKCFNEYNLGMADPLSQLT